MRAVHEPPLRRAQWRDAADDVTPRRPRRALEAELAVGRLGVVGEHEGVGQLALLVQNFAVPVGQQVVRLGGEPELVLCGKFTEEFLSKFYLTTTTRYVFLYVLKHD